jgi:PQQ-dependent catabolism-associated beta-propeller protein
MMQKNIAAALLGLAALAVQAEGVVYVSSEKDHALTVVDIKTQTVTGTVATCKRPRHMQRSSDGKQLWVACSESNVVDVIDLATRKSLRRIPIGEDPEVFDLSPDGKTIYVGHEDDAQLAYIDVASGKQVKAIEVGKEPEGVKVSPDGKTIWVASEAASLVHVIDAASGSIVKNIPVGKRPRRFALTPDGKELWVTSELDASVSIISNATNAVIATLKFEVPGARSTEITPVGITMTRDGSKAFVALGKANHVAFIDVAARKVTSLALVGRRVWAVTLNQAETILYAVNGLSDDMSIVDVGSAKALKTVRVGRVPYMAVVVE